MAKGNIGNGLEIFVECIVAHTLLEISKSKQIHLLDCFGMQPYEPARSHQSAAPRLSNALNQFISICHEDASLVGVKTAIDKLGENFGPQMWPNSSQIVEALASGLGCTLTGTVIEMEPSKCHYLRLNWKDKPVAVSQGSWRNHILSAASPEKNCPWMMLFDPFTWEANKAQPTDGNLSSDDLPLISKAIQKFLRASEPGGIAMLAYRLDPSGAIDFFNNVEQLYRQNNLHVQKIYVPTDNNASQFHTACIGTTNALVIQALVTAGTKCGFNCQVPTDLNQFLTSLAQPSPNA